MAYLAAGIVRQTTVDRAQPQSRQHATPDRAGLITPPERGQPLPCH